MQLIENLEHYPSAEQIFSLIHDKEDAVFLDSSLTGTLGQYSIIGLHPYLKLVLGRDFTVNGIPSADSFESFVRQYLKDHYEENPSALPLTSGAIGYFSYDYGREKEHVPSKHPREVDIPDCILVFYDSFLIEDHTSHRLYLITNDHAHDCQKSMAELRKLVKSAFSTLSPGVHPQGTGIYPQISANFNQKDYMTAIRQMIRYIIEGDIYIANMTQQLQVKSELPPYDMFRILRRRNPSPFGGYLNYGDFQIVSASPERFLQMRSGHIQTRPIKGTRKRGTTPEEDRTLRQELEQSGKDMSELLMIVDLERNDLNRVCVPGSVQVTELFSVETYATVFHLISNVIGDLSPGLTVMDLIEAAFPGGSITGAPKLRAMEIIDELEHSRRNLYTGSLGYISLDGDCDFNIVIRTALYQNGVYHIGAGGGITFESDPEFEYDETLQKAKALLQALGGTPSDLERSGILPNGYEN